MALPTAGRAAFVAAECADDAVVGEEVLALLAEVERGEQTAFMNAADAAAGLSLDSSAKARPACYHHSSSGAAAGSVQPALGGVRPAHCG